MGAITPFHLTKLFLLFLPFPTVLFNGLNVVVVFLLLLIFKFSIPTIKNYCIKWNTLKYCTRSHSLFSYSHFANACVGAVEFKVTQRQTNYKVNGQSKRFQRVKGLHFLLAPQAPAHNPSLPPSLPHRKWAFCHLFFLFYFHVLYESIDYFMHF